MCLSKRVFLMFVILLFSLSVLCASKLVLFRTKTDSEDSDAFEYGLSYINVESGYFNFNVSCNFDSPVLFSKVIEIYITYGEPWITRLSHSSTSYSSSSSVKALLLKQLHCIRHRR